MSNGLVGKRVLVVEDEYFIAADLKRALDSAGAEVVGPVADLDAAMALAEGRLDAAILDVNLEGTLTYSVADRLASAHVPHMFVTGYDGWSLPAAYQATPRLSKPFAPANVLAMVETLCAAPTT